MTKRATPRSPYRSAAHRALAEREIAIGEATIAQGQDAVFRAIAHDRRTRWAALLAGREESSDIRTWATAMAALHGASVRIHRTRGLDWITALYVVRYGEAEDYWPERLGPDDLIKAQRWYRGERRPLGVVYEREE